jgi:hypothetical protein
VGEGGTEESEGESEGESEAKTTIVLKKRGRRAAAADT